MDITILFDAGLTVNEAKVYMALLELGCSSVIEISKKSKVHRVNTYDVLERLQTKGLISLIIKKNKQFYEASDPEHLLHLIDSKKENIKRAIPEMKLLFNIKKDKQKVQYYKGVQGVYYAYNLILEQNKTLYGLGGSGYNRKILKHRHEIWDKERIKKKIHVYSLYYESSRKEKKDDKERLWKIKFLPNKFQSNLMIDICGNLTIILLPNLNIEQIMAIVINNQEIAEGYRKLFKYMWKFAKK